MRFSATIALLLLQTVLGVKETPGGVIRIRTTALPSHSLSFADLPDLRAKLGVPYASSGEYLEGLVSLVYSLFRVSKFERIEYVSNWAVAEYRAMLDAHRNLMGQFTETDESVLLKANELLELLNPSGLAMGSPAAISAVDRVTQELLLNGNDLLQKISVNIPFAAETPLFKVRSLNRTSEYENLERPSRLVKIVTQEYLASISPSVTVDELAIRFGREDAVALSDLSFGELAVPLVDADLVDDLEAMVNRGHKIHVPGTRIILPLSEQELSSVVPDSSCLVYPGQDNCWSDLNTSDDRSTRIKLSIVLLAIAQSHAIEWRDQLALERDPFPEAHGPSVDTPSVGEWEQIM